MDARVQGKGMLVMSGAVYVVVYVKLCYYYVNLLSRHNQAELFICQTLGGHDVAGGRHLS